MDTLFASPDLLGSNPKAASSPGRFLFRAKCQKPFEPMSSLTRELSCSAPQREYRSPMTQEGRSSLVFTATLFLVAAAWLFFLFAYADVIFRH